MDDDEILKKDYEYYKALYSWNKTKILLKLNLNS